MRCHICDASLNDNEIQWNPEHEDWDPCGTCQAIIDEVFEPLDDEEIEKQLEFEFTLIYGPFDSEEQPESSSDEKST